MDYKHEPLSQRSSTEFSKDTLLEKEEYHPPPPPRGTLRRWLPMLVIHAVLIFVYTAISFTAIQKVRASVMAMQPNLIDSPARSAVVNEQTKFDYRPTSMQKWFGTPSEAVDEKWNDILDFGTIKFSREDMIRYGREKEGVELADATGYMGTLNVFHELHCLKRIYMFIHKDKYFKDYNLTEYEQNFNLKHTMHCMDTIRQGIQCRADISPVTYQWGAHQRLPVANFTSPHECKNWDSIMMWAKRNSFDPTYPGLVVHPKYGPVYDERPNMGRKIGIVDDKAVSDNSKLEGSPNSEEDDFDPAHRHIAEFSPKIHD